MIGSGDEVILTRRHRGLPVGRTGYVFVTEKSLLGYKSRVWFSCIQEYKMVPHRKLDVLRKYTHPIYIPGPDGAHGDYVHMTFD